MNDLPDVLQRVIQVTNEFRSDPNDPESWNSFGPNTAVCQDAMIFGVHVEDYVDKLEEEFGAIVWQIPWLEYTDQTDSFRGCAVFWLPFVLLGRLISKTFTGNPILKNPDPRNFSKRLELGHIAKVIENDHWIEP